MDHCVWGNRSITDIGANLWNSFLIDKNILYLSQFITERGEVMSYNQFRDKWDILPRELSSLEYATIKLAIRRFNSPSTRNKNITLIDPEISLRFITGHNNQGLRSKNLRDKMISRESPNTLPPMLQWSQELDKNIDWCDVFSNLFFSLCNNFKLIQFHFKLWHRIATCKYMRHKMKIDTDSPSCSLCNGELETLPHIYLDCVHTREFRGKINRFITANIDANYRDKKHHILTLSHHDRRINFINAASNWYLGYAFQRKSLPNFVEFIKHLKLALLGEKPTLINSLENCGL